MFQLSPKMSMLLEVELAWNNAGRPKSYRPRDYLFEKYGIDNQTNSPEK